MRTSRRRGIIGTWLARIRLWPRSLSPRWPFLLAIATALALGLALMVGSTVLGVIHGMQDTVEMRRRSAAFHYEQGIRYLRAGRRELALAEFQETLRLNPRHTGAQRQVIALLLPTPTPIPTPTPTPVPTQNPNAPLETVLAAAREDLAAHRWQQAYARLEQLHALAPQFHPEEVRDLLYQAAYNEGVELVQEDRMEEALRAFDRALRWKPDDKQARRQRDWAEAYILGVSYFYVDWDNAIAIFQSLYREAPTYKDVRARYLDALKLGADYYLQHGLPCKALKYYERLQEIDPHIPIGANMATARTECTEK